MGSPGAHFGSKLRSTKGLKMEIRDGIKSKSCNCLLISIKNYYYVIYFSTITTVQLSYHNSKTYPIAYQ